MAKNYTFTKKTTVAALICGSMALSGCNLADHDQPVDPAKLVDRSVTPALVM